MKKYVFLIFILAFTNFIACAQIFHAGVIGGITASQVDGDSYSGYNKAGLYAGVFVSHSLLPWLDAKFEIRYASRGAKNPASDDNTGYYKLALHYIDVPIMGAVHVKKYGDFEIGLIPGYLFASSGSDDSGKLPHEYLVDFNKFDLDLLLGANFHIMPKLSMDFRYAYSIFSIRDKETAGSYYSWFGKIFGYTRGDFNNCLSLGFSYTIR
jgi:hypothetical protein